MLHPMSVRNGRVIHTQIEIVFGLTETAICFEASRGTHGATGWAVNGYGEEIPGTLNTARTEFPTIGVTEHAIRATGYTELVSKLRQLTPRFGPKLADERLTIGDTRHRMVHFQSANHPMHIFKHEIVRAETEHDSAYVGTAYYLVNDNDPDCPIDIKWEAWIEGIESEFDPLLPLNPLAGEPI